MHSFRHGAFCALWKFIIAYPAGSAWARKGCRVAKQGCVLLFQGSLGKFICNKSQSGKSHKSVLHVVKIVMKVALFSTWCVWCPLEVNRLSSGERLGQKEMSCCVTLGVQSFPRDKSLKSMHSDPRKMRRARSCRERLCGCYRGA